MLSHRTWRPPCRLASLKLVKISNKRSKIILAAVFQAPPMPLGRPSTAADRPPPPSYTSNEKSELEAAYRQADARAQQLGAARAMEQGQNTVGQILQG